MLTAPRLTAALALLMGSLAVASLTPLDVDKRQSATCAAVHLFVARGTTEPPGDGLIGSLAQLVLGANPGATEESIDYPATSDPIYLPSVTIGIEAVTEQVTSYVSACPNSTLVLMGYSQGAQIILDALCGSGSPELGGTGEPTIILEQGANSESRSVGTSRPLMREYSCSSCRVWRSQSSQRRVLESRHCHQKWGKLHQRDVRLGRGSCMLIRAALWIEVSPASRGLQCVG
jgi:hypothetical protein